VCGIAGYINKEAMHSAIEENVRAMLNKIKHRGPDDSGTIVSASVGLGNVRLAITDLLGGKQPFTYGCKGSKLILVFNGEIYNHLELKQELIKLGHVFLSSHSDTEVVMHAFEEWGVASFGRFNGMFAIAIFDELSKVMYLARDRFGEKPLYIFNAEGVFAFASEIKCLVDVCNLRGSFDWQVIDAYINFGYKLNNKTFFDRVDEVPAGAFTIIDTDDGQKTKSLVFNFFEPFRLQTLEIPGLNDESIFEKLFVRAVEMRLNSDAQTGVFLSGGLDSSAVAVATARIGAGIDTFTIGFENSRFDESRYAIAVSKHLRLVNHLEICRESDLMRITKRLPEIFDEPIGDPSVIPTTFLSEFASGWVKVALGGDGSDELMYGYNTYSALWKLTKFKPLLNAFNALNTENLQKLFPGNLQRNLSYQKEISSFTDVEKVFVLLSPNKFSYFWNSETAISELHSATRSIQADIDTMKTFRNAYIAGYLEKNILVKSDRSSMSASVELRSPFLDYELSHWILQLKTESHFRSSGGKRLLKKMLHSELPNSILNRPKQGFGAPMDDWFRGQLGDYAEELFNEKSFPSHSLAVKYNLPDLLIRHRENQINVGNQLWAMLVLCQWLNHWS